MLYITYNYNNNNSFLYQYGGDLLRQHFRQDYDLGRSPEKILPSFWILLSETQNPIFGKRLKRHHPEDRRREWPVSYGF